MSMLPFAIYRNPFVLLPHTLIYAYAKCPHFYLPSARRSGLDFLLESLAEQITVGAIAVHHDCYAYACISAFFLKMLRDC